MNLIELETAIEIWGKEKGILDNATPYDQFKKTLEEVDELDVAILNQRVCKEEFYTKKGNLVNTQEEINDAIGDIVVTLILQAKLQGTTLTECLNGAYGIISKRTGKMIGGQFVKSEDL